MEAHFLKVNGALYPATDKDREVLSKIKAGEAVKLKFTRARNYQYHKKYFAMLNLAFDYWEPPENMVAEKNFDRFRKDVTILAGYYNQYVRLDGETRVEAKSIAFGNMSEDEFEQLYSKTIDVLIRYALNQYSGDELRGIVDMIEDFE